MKKIMILVLSVLPFIGQGQNPEENHIKSSSYLIAVDEADEATINSSQKIETVTYYDGLGRPIQVISARAGGAQQNIVQHLEYDELGRAVRQYLPYATSGVVETNTLEIVPRGVLKAGISDFYNTPKYEHTQNPYAETLFENSPLNRSQEQAAPGESWKYDPENFEYVNPVYYAPGEALPYQFTSKLYDFGTFFDPLVNGQSIPFELENREQVADGKAYQLAISGIFKIIKDGVNTILTFNLMDSPEAYGNSLGANVANWPERQFELGVVDRIQVYPVIGELELGYLNDENGNPTHYKLSIINNEMVLSNDLETPETVRGLGFNISINLNEQNLLKSYDDKVYNNHTIRLNYDVNVFNEVRYFDVTFNGGNTQSPSIVYAGNHYAPGELYKNTTKDENWTPTSGDNHTTQEFTNKQGQVVLKRTFNDNQAHDTYYIYDDYGNLTYVLSPEGSKRIISTNGSSLSSNAQQVLERLCYQYKSINRKENSWKRLGVYCL